MRAMAAVTIFLLAATAATAGPTRKWGVEIEWGDSIPAGTVYNVKCESDGHFKAERRGLPFVANGLTTVVHETTLPELERGNVPASVESRQRFRPISYATCSFVSSMFLLTRTSSAATS